MDFSFEKERVRLGEGCSTAFKCQSSLGILKRVEIRLPESARAQLHESKHFLGVFGRYLQKKGHFDLPTNIKIEQIE